MCVICLENWRHTWFSKSMVDMELLVRNTCSIRGSVCIAEYPKSELSVFMRRQPRTVWPRASATCSKLATLSNKVWAILSFVYRCWKKIQSLTDWILSINPYYYMTLRKQLQIDLVLGECQYYRYLGKDFFAVVSTNFWSRQEHHTHCVISRRRQFLSYFFWYNLFNCNRCSRSSWKIEVSNCVAEPLMEKKPYCFKCARKKKKK